MSAADKDSPVAMINRDSTPRKEFELVLRQYRLSLGKVTRIMGILNVTPDSFSADGIYQDLGRARERALQMAGEGAHIIDVGGESTRPGAHCISVKEEQKRVLPVIRQLVQEIKLPISIDTYKAEVARAALSEGASLVNDISGLTFDPQMAEVVAQFGAGCVLMHIRGTPRTMQQNPTYTALIPEIVHSLQQSISRAQAAGIHRESLMVDPGIGFGKTTAHNLEIIQRLKEFASLGLPLLIGPSRKSFIGNVLNLSPDKRLLGTAAAVAVSILNGAHIVRVHDVKEMVQVTRMVDAILGGEG